MIMKLSFEVRLKQYGGSQFIEKVTKVLGSRGKQNGCLVAAKSKTTL